MDSSFLSLLSLFLSIDPSFSSSSMAPPLQPLPDPSTYDARFVTAYSALFRQLQTYVVCTLAVVVWDIIITLKLEMQYVWPSRWSAVKFCFFVARYLTLATLGFMVACAFSENLTKHCQRIYHIQVKTAIKLSCLS
jgi:hypothetical protein